YWQRSFGSSDHHNLVATGYSSHPSLATVNRDPEQFPLFLSGAGYFEEVPPPAPLPPERVALTVLAPSGTFANGDGSVAAVQQPSASATNGKRPSYAVAAAVAKEQYVNSAKGEVRILLFADLDMLADGIVENIGNRQVLLDGLAYLTMDEAHAVVVERGDKLIAHTAR